MLAKREAAESDLSAVYPRLYAPTRPQDPKALKHCSKPWADACFHG